MVNIKFSRISIFTLLFLVSDKGFYIVRSLEKVKEARIRIKDGVPALFVPHPRPLSGIMKSEAVTIAC